MNKLLIALILGVLMMGKMRKIIISLMFVTFAFNQIAYAVSIDYDRLANAIYKAEGGAKTSHPYGILAKYKHTTPRKACINTCKHAFKDWNGKGSFIAFLGSRYCPVGAKNDPMGLNKNWVGNVTRFYNAS